MLSIWIGQCSILKGGSDVMMPTALLLRFGYHVVIKERRASGLCLRRARARKPITPSKTSFFFDSSRKTVRARQVNTPKPEIQPCPFSMKTPTLPSSFNLVAPSPHVGSCLRCSHVFVYFAHCGFVRCYASATGLPSAKCPSMSGHRSFLARRLLLPVFRLPDDVEPRRRDLQ